ncbi:unnamed protein product [Urochloa decumbens]|uniref:Uncharacterized protein n=1 Tax=Urochloa decumbens TaxID=240449 RepID=A0ABC9ASU4_9POAL
MALPNGPVWLDRPDVVIPRALRTYLGINEGRQNRLCLAWSINNGHLDRFMLTVRALETVIGSKDVRFCRIAFDPHQFHAFVLCPTHEMAMLLRGASDEVGNDRIFFNYVLRVTVPPFGDDVDQHLRTMRLM